MKDTQEYYAKSKEDWRKWLETNHIEEDSIWLVFYKKHTGIPSLTWSESVDEALCFGWIDGRKQSLDDKSYRQYFSKRKPNSTWSKVNKDKITNLTQSGLMFPLGIKAVEIAKENGSWNILNDVDNMIFPKELKEMFSKHPGTEDFIISQKKSIIKGIIYWIITAKRPETKKKRVMEIIEAAREKLLPKRFS